MFIIASPDTWVLNECFPRTSSRICKCNLVFSNSSGWRFPWWRCFDKMLWNIEYWWDSVRTQPFSWSPCAGHIAILGKVCRTEFAIFIGRPFVPFHCRYHFFKRFLSLGNLKFFEHYQYLLFFEIIFYNNQSKK